MLCTYPSRFQASDAVRGADLLIAHRRINQHPTAIPTTPNITATAMPALAPPERPDFPEPGLAEGLEVG